MKKLLPILLAITLLLTLPGCGGDSDVPAGMIRASGDIVDYDLFVPDTWTPDLTGGAVSAFRSISDPTNVSVMVWNLPHTDTSLGDWWNTYRAEFELVFSDFKEEATETTTLDGVAADKHVYTATLGGNTYRYTQIAAIRRGSVYLLTVTELANAPAEGMPNSDEQAEERAGEISEILRCFRWR